MKYLLPLGVCALFIACGNEKPAEKQDSAINIPVVHSQVSDIQPYRPNIELTPWEGNLNDAMYWQDLRGENIILISTNPQYMWAETKPQLINELLDQSEAETLEEVTEVFARHYVLPAGTAEWTLKYEFSDLLFGCCDVFLEYQPGTLQIMDADSNGKGEMLFTYHYTEGDGKLAGTWSGREVLLIDSTSYAVKGYSATEDGKPDKFISNTCPFESPYEKIMTTKWETDVAAWKELLANPAAESAKDHSEEGHSH